MQVQVNAQNLLGDLQDLDFRNILGGPLQAIMDAQQIASRAAIEYINDVAFFIDPATGRQNIKTVNYEIERLSSNGTSQISTLVLPLLMLTPVPFLEIATVEIEFTVKLNSVSTTTHSSSFEFQSGAGLGASFKASVSSQSSSSSSQQVKQDYSLVVKVGCKQAEAPQGFQRVMDWMERMINEDETAPTG